MGIQNIKMCDSVTITVQNRVQTLNLPTFDFTRDNTPYTPDMQPAFQCPCVTKVQYNGAKFLVPRHPTLSDDTEGDDYATYECREQDNLNDKSFYVRIIYKRNDDPNAERFSMCMWWGKKK